ncbi:XRE family transcriptional regulator [Weissella coleopterorum]|uniref:XRE family transcriptional regulator n=1 Tax=Weissella coleopterorum TaxID=2714949 RepID=A0A6G8AY40_9LACO|nr:replication initiation factor domain-containing protein [Weissella coleopterorum]QIL49916.1 XRE family transcriptional regulator [Weissella coleopterorum]
MIKINNEYFNYECIYFGTVQHGLMKSNTLLMQIGLFQFDELIKSMYVNVHVNDNDVLPMIGNELQLESIKGSELMGYTGTLKSEHVYELGYEVFKKIDDLEQLKNIGKYQILGDTEKMLEKIEHTPITGKTFKTIRETLKLTQSEIGNNLGVSRQLVASLEKDNKEIKPEYLDTLISKYPALRSNIDVQFDWITFNFPELTGDEVISKILNVKKGLFLARNTSQNFYTREFVYGGEKNIYIQDFEPEDDEVIDGGIQKDGASLFMTGIGVRQFENILAEQGLTWLQFFKKMYQYRGHCTRLDVAINDNAEVLNMDDLVKAVQEKRFWSKAKSYAIHGNAQQGWTVNFGKSPFVIRIYDKFKEQAGKGKTTDINTRVELELHSDKATQLIDEWLGSDNLVGFTFDILKSSLLFVDEKVDETQLKGQNDKERYYDKLKPMPAWDLLTALGGKAKFKTESKPVTVERTKNWVENYVAPSLKMLQQTGNWDFVLEIIMNAELSPEQEALVKTVNTFQKSETLESPKTLKIDQGDLENDKI